MAKDKSLKSDSNPKRKKINSNASEVHAEEMMDTKVKKKKRKMEVEVSSTVSCTAPCFRQHNLTLLKNNVLFV